MKRTITEPLPIIGLGENFTAQGWYLPDGKVKIKTGSLLNANTTNATRERIAGIREVLFHTIIKNNCLTEDYTFKNVSEAASVISGSMRNGNVVFRTMDGILLSEYMQVDFNDEKPKTTLELIEQDDSEGIISTNTIVDYKPKELGSYQNEKKVNIYKRDSKSLELAIIQANFKCEVDKTHTTFLTKSGKPYVEGHHLIPVSAQGDFKVSIDVPSNIVSLCPNCHRQLHFGVGIDARLKQLLEIKTPLLEKSGISINFEKLSEYYR